MNLKHLKKIYIISAVCSVIIITVILAYLTNFPDPISKFFKRFYPQAIVGNGLISLAYWDEAHDLGRKIDPNSIGDAIARQLVKVKEESQLLRSLKVSFPSPTLEDELKFYSTGKTEEYKSLLNKYFQSSESKFIEFVVKPQIYDALLRMKYNSDFVANNNSYSRAQDILNKVQNGQSFDDLAKTQSDDQVTGQLGGDLGFVIAGQLLPELEQSAFLAPLGQVIPKVIITRLGYEIVLPVETATNQDGQKTWHIKHILVKTTDYDAWLAEMTKRFWVWRIKS